jgi:hypothetical protein
VAERRAQAATEPSEHDGSRSDRTNGMPAWSVAHPPTPRGWCPAWHIGITNPPSGVMTICNYLLPCLVEVNAKRETPNGRSQKAERGIFHSLREADRQLVPGGNVTVCS